MTIEKIREFRLKQSEEKIAIAKRLFAKGDCRNAVVQAYLSIFYAARILLLEQGEDSDNFDKIVELSRKYFQPSGWLSVDIGTMLEQGRSYHEKIEKNCLGEVELTEVKQFIENADKIREAVAKEK
jgi:uncharacterized protein (UPF0332 family)